jgi:hypothetical protein
MGTPQCVCVCVFITAGPSTKLSRGLGRRIHGSVEDTKLSTNKQHSLWRGEGGILEDMCYERRRAEACVD